MTEDPLFGRDVELWTLRELAERCVAGNGCFVLVSGEAGVGKTALIRAALAGTPLSLIAADGIRDGSVPYAPVVEIMRALLRRTPGVDGALDSALRVQLAVLIPEFGSPAAVLDRACLVEAVRTVLAVAALAEPMALLFDDMHGADEATFDLLLSLSPVLTATRTLVIVVARSDEARPGHPVRRFRAELRRRRALHEITVGPLGADAVEALLQVTLGGQVGGSLCDAVVGRTDGVAFFVAELANAMVVGDLLTTGPNGFELAAGADLPLPDGVRDAVLMRAAQLSADARRAIGVAAIVGNTFGIDMVAELAGLDTWPGDPALAAWVVERPHGRMAFRHELAREAFYADLAWLDRRRVHAACAARLVLSNAPAQVVAEHWDHAGDRDRARRAFVVAAETCCALHAHRDGLRLAKRAVDLWPVDTDDDARLDALDTLARCAELAGLPGEAIAARRELVDACRAAGDPARCGHALRRLAGVLEGQGRWDEALDNREQAAQCFGRAGAPGDAATERLAAASHLRSSAGFTAALGLIDLAADDARAAGRIDLDVRISALRGNVLARLGQATEGIVMVREALDTALRYDLVAPAGEIFQRLADSLEHTGDYAAATATYDEATDFCAAGGIKATEQLCLACLATVLRRTGEWERATGLCREVLASDAATSHARGAAGAMLGSILVLRGDHREGRALLIEARSTGQTIDLLALRLLSAWGLALADWLAGDGDRARQRCRELLAQWQASEDRHYGMTPLRWAATVFAEAGDGAGAGACAAALADILADIGSPEAASALAHALGERSLIDGDAVGAADHFARALDLLDGAGAPFELLETKRRHAAALAGSARRDEAVESLSSAYRIARRLKAQPLAVMIGHALADLDATADRRLSKRQSEQIGHQGLSRRELEVVRLVAAGGTNREIAAQLFVSVRTVDMHVRNILRKLDCRSRSDVVRVASERRLEG